MLQGLFLIRLLEGSGVAPVRSIGTGPACALAGTPRRQRGAAPAVLRTPGQSKAKGQPL